eukprot:GGOE01002707.1.p1 GENE.GGOE01002707.1~~GGOE01002707.1.p1  ORF type:complete len:861 (-),score=171.15 GGOE01002707.1:83-2665(-)
MGPSWPVLLLVSVFLWWLPRSTSLRLAFFIIDTPPRHECGFHDTIIATLTELRDAYNGTDLHLWWAAPEEDHWFGEEEVATHVSAAINKSIQEQGEELLVVGFGPTCAAAFDTVPVVGEKIQLVIVNTDGTRPKASSPRQNLHVVRLRVEQAAFLHGVIAALIGDDSAATVPRVAFYGVATLETDAHLAGFTQGLFYVDPRIRPVVRRFPINHTGTVYNRLSSNPDANATLASIRTLAAADFAAAPIIYSALGEYNQAVFLAAFDAGVLQQLTAFVISDACCQRPPRRSLGDKPRGSAAFDLTSVLLSTVLLHLDVVVRGLVQRGTHSAFSLPSSPLGLGEGVVDIAWDAPGNTTGVVTGWKGRRCGDTTVFGMVEKVRAAVLQAQVAVPLRICNASRGACQAPSKPHRCSAATQPGQLIRKVGVAVFINHLQAVDIKAGNFYADFNLYLYQAKEQYATVAELKRSYTDLQKDECNMKIGEFEAFALNSPEYQVNFLNMEASRTLEQLSSVKEGSNKTFHHYNVRGMFALKPNLVDWPFGSITMPLVFEQKIESSETLKSVAFCWMPSFSGISPSVMLPGLNGVEGLSYRWGVWDVCWPPYLYPERSVCINANQRDCECATSLSADAKPVRFPHYSDVTCRCMGGVSSSTRFEFQVLFARARLPAIVTVFLPPLFIVLVNQASFMLEPQAGASKIGICATALTSSVMFHSSITSKIPEHTSTSTLADRFMAVVYYINLLTWLNAMIQLQLHQLGRARHAALTFQISRFCGPLVSAVCLLGLTISTNVRFLVSNGLVATAVLLLLPVGAIFWGRCPPCWCRRQRVGAEDPELSRELLAMDDGNSSATDEGGRPIPMHRTDL